MKKSRAEKQRDRIQKLVEAVRKQGEPRPVRTTWTCRNCGPLPVNKFYAYNKSLCKSCMYKERQEWREQYRKNFGRAYSGSSAGKRER